MSENPANPIRIARLERLQDFDAVVELQRAIWGYGDVDIESRVMLVLAAKFIGQLLGAFDGDRLIGFAVAFCTPNPKAMHSHRVGVLPEYQSRGVGKMLKLAQRTHCLQDGIDTLDWTFDPLQAGNAHFNINLLGGIVRTYLPNLYGRTTSPLHAGLPTDRLLVEWRLDSERVERVLAGQACAPREVATRISIPTAEQRNEATQGAVREQFLQAFAGGNQVTAFDRETREYILEKA